MDLAFDLTIELHQPLWNTYSRLWLSGRAPFPKAAFGGAKYKAPVSPSAAASQCLKVD